MREAIAGKGIDPRTWVSAARIEHTESMRWEPTYGWVVDVQFYGSGLDQVGEVPCRVLSSGPPGDGFGEYLPPAIDCEVLVGISGGEPDGDPVVLGFLSNQADGKPPEEVNGLPIEAELQLSTDAAVSPYDTEIKRSPHHRREQYDGDHTLQARRVVIRGDERIQLIVESGAKLEVIGRGQSTVEIRHEGSGAIIVDGPDIRLGEGANPIARVGDLGVGHAVPATPNPDGTIPVAIRLVSGSSRAKS